MMKLLITVSLDYRLQAVIVPYQPHLTTRRDEWQCLLLAPICLVAEETESEYDYGGMAGSWGFVVTVEYFGIWMNRIPFHFWLHIRHMENVCFIQLVKAE